MAIMTHISYFRELSTQKVNDSIIICSQNPVMRGINGIAVVWADKWRTEVNMEIIPYHMFMAHNTGAQYFFDVPMAKVNKTYYADL